MAGRGSIEHLSQVLDLFNDARGIVAVDEIVTSLGLTRSTAYRTVRALADAGFLDRVSDEGYALGPRVLELYRQLQIANPLLVVSRPVMIALAGEAVKGTSVLLCRAYRERVMCVHQEIAHGPQEPVSYQVGRPMPLYRGSSSLTVLAAFDRLRLVKLYARDRADIAAAGLGPSLEEFLDSLKQIRRAGYRVSQGEVDKGRIGVAAPIVAKSHNIYGSISLVLSQANATDLDVSRAVVQVVTAAHDIVHKLSVFGSDRGELAIARPAKA